MPTLNQLADSLPSGTDLYKVKFRQKNWTNDAYFMVTMVTKRISGEGTPFSCFVGNVYIDDELNHKNEFVGDLFNQWEILDYGAARMSLKDFIGDRNPIGLKIKSTSTDSPSIQCTFFEIVYVEHSTDLYLAISSVPDLRDRPIGVCIHASEEAVWVLKEDEEKPPKRFLKYFLGKEWEGDFEIRQPSWEEGVRFIPKFLDDAGRYYGLVINPFGYRKGHSLHGDEEGEWMSVVKSEVKI